ncbi:MAG: hypothetical protein SWQ30_17975 [Thermodesulfobacteriota bacterium]|nr:hypothetical protein [Thermodesulfobacteriota bacterium]
MSARFFGEFLVENGALTSAQLDSALAHQKQNNVLVGALAVKKGYMTQGQVDEIVTLQRKLNDKFGQIAIEKKYLTMDQLGTLLGMQAENHLYLGEAIVRMGLVDAEKTQTHLNAYLRESRKETFRFDLELKSVPIREIVEVIVEISTTYFYRLGLMAKVDGLTTTDDVPDGFLGHVLFAEQDVNKTKCTFGLVMGKVLFGYLIDVLCGGVKALRFEDKHEQLAEMVYYMNYNICEELKKRGYKASYGPATSIAPQTPKKTIIKMKTVVSPFYLAYYHSDFPTTG